MSEQSIERDGQWNKLLTCCYGEEVEADTTFKSNLLQKLKTRTAENRHSAETTDSAEDRNWSRLLQTAHEPCEPRAGFKSHLLGQLKARSTQLTGPVRTQAEEDVLKKVLTASYTPVEPRREFQTRLLENLKERQRNTTVLRRASRRRTLFLSAMSSMAAAAAVLFVVWAAPFSATTPASPLRPSASPVIDDNLIEFASAPAPERNTSFAAMVTDAAAPAAAGLAFASFTPYRVEDTFNQKALPEAVLGRGMEVNHGEGWHPMTEDTYGSIRPGMQFRPASSGSKTAGLGFNDGSSILMCADSMIEATADGFTVKQGTMAVDVPESSANRFRLNFPERDIAVEPGTMLAVTMPAPDAYADGGSPAPLVRVADGGMAVARGRNGSGILLANQVYRLYDYVTPEIPGRPLCEAECEDLERTLLLPNGPSTNNGQSAGSNYALFASAGGSSFSTMPATPVGFIQKDSRWVAKDYRGQQTVKIKYLSDDYFGLASSRRDLAPALALGADVIIDGKDDIFYEIYK